MEISTGEEVMERDLISVESRDLNEAELGYRTEPFVKMQPAFKDYLWGGTKLKEHYGKHCDYDSIAESWELSAHEAGQSIVASGRYQRPSVCRLSVENRAGKLWLEMPVD